MMLFYGDENPMALPKQKHSSQHVPTCSLLHPNSAVGEEILTRSVRIAGSGCVISMS
jgi:hypothetical protein